MRSSPSHRLAPILRAQRRYLTTKQLAERWEVPASWIYSNRERLAIPTLKVGAHYRFALEQILKWESLNSINIIQGGSNVADRKSR
jgi:hypothetical protein